MQQIYTAVMLSFILFFSNNSMDKPVTPALHPEDLLLTEKMLEATSIHDTEIFELDSQLFSAQSALCQNMKFGTPLHTTIEELLQFPVEILSTWKNAVVKINDALHASNTQSAKLLELLDQTLDKEDAQEVSLSSGCTRKALNKRLSIKNNEYAAVYQQLKEELVNARKKITITPLISVEQMRTELSRIIPTSYIPRLLKVTEFAYAADKIVPAQKPFLYKLAQLQALFGLPKETRVYPVCTDSEDERLAVLTFCKTQSLDLQKNAKDKLSIDVRKTTRATECRSTLAKFNNDLKETLEQLDFLSKKSTFITTPFRQLLNIYKKNLESKIQEMRKYLDRKRSESPKNDENDPNT